MSNIVRFNDDDDVEVLTRGRGHIANPQSLEFLRHVNPEMARTVERTLFQNKALETIAPAAEVMAQAAGAAVVGDLAAGATEAESGFDLHVSSDYWRFFGLTGESHNVHMSAHLWARSNKPRR